MKVNYILGAGFSIPAGFPSTLELNQKFFSEVENKILKSSSGEWSWDHYYPATSQNGRLNFEHLNISYLLSEFVEAFQNETSLPFDYEEFRDYLHKPFSKQFIEEKCLIVNKRLVAEGISPTSPHLFKDPDINQYYQVQYCYEYLIADILAHRLNKEKDFSVYSNYLVNLTHQEEANIFTLNHDLLLEYLFHGNNITYSDGFSIYNSNICNEEKKPLAIFTDIYSERIKLYKLHGSIDYHQYDELVAARGNIYNHTGNYWFFKSNNYWEIHHSIRIDPMTKEILQSVHADIKPKFLTGKSKLKSINNHKVYQQLFKHFENCMSNCDVLVIIGYSYQDTHINKIIKETTERRKVKIINVNPNVSFPFRRDYSSSNISNLKSIDML